MKPNTQQWFRLIGVLFIAAGLGIGIVFYSMKYFGEPPVEPLVDSLETTPRPEIVCTEEREHPPLRGHRVLCTTGTFGEWRYFLYIGGALRDITRNPPVYLLDITILLTGDIGPFIGVAFRPIGGAWVRKEIEVDAGYLLQSIGFIGEYAGV